MFDNGFKPFIKEISCIGGRDLLDEFMAHIFAKVKAEFPRHEIEAIHDFEMHPSRRPKVLVQTAAHVAGAAYYYQRSSVSNDPWDQKNKDLWSQRACQVWRLVCNQGCGHFQGHLGARLAEKRTSGCCTRG